METSGLDPEITICKIAVLPIKLCPLVNSLFGLILTLTFTMFSTAGRLLCLPIRAQVRSYIIMYGACSYKVKRCWPSKQKKKNIFLISYLYSIRKRTWTSMILHQRSLSSSCLPIPALGCYKKIYYNIS